MKTDWFQRKAASALSQVRTTAAIVLCGVLLVPLLSVSACEGGVDIPEGTPAEIDRYVEGMVRFYLTNYPAVGEPLPEVMRVQPVPVFVQYLYHDCQRTNSNPVVLGSNGQPNPVLDACPTWDEELLEPEAPSTCSEAMCLSAAAYCVAERLSEISGIVEDYESSRFTPLNNNGTQSIVVPPQTPRANALLVAGAAEWVGRAIRAAGSNIESGMSLRPATSSSGICRPRSTNTGWLFNPAYVILDPLGDSEADRDYSDMLLSILVDSVDLGSTVADQVERHFAAVADAEYSENASQSVAAGFAWTSGDTSRAAGASVLLGGDGGLYGIPNGYGHLGELTIEERRALGIIRGAGPNVEQLIGTPESIVSEVAVSMSEYAGQLDGTITPGDILDERGLTLQHYEGAARWLLNEIEIHQVSERELPDGRSTATTTMEMVPPTEALLVGVRQGSATSPLDLQTTLLARARIPDTHALRGLAPAIGYAANVVIEATRRAGPGTRPFDATTEQVARLNDVLAGAMTAVTNARPARLSFCRGSSPQRWEVTYVGPAQRLDLRLIDGVDGLRCALTGSINGAPCRMDDFTFSSEDPYPTEVVSAGWSVRSSVLRWIVNPMSEQSDHQVFVIAANRNTDGDIVSYSAVGGSRFPTAQRCHEVPIVPTVTAAAARLITPDPVDTQRAAVGCAGIPNSQRIPLEDELSNDGDQFESSWRHYLNLAAEAAAEADRLGEAVIANGLDIEQRVELATAGIEQLCGGAVDVDFLSFGAGTMGPTMACASRTDGEIVEDDDRGYVCTGGVAVPDALQTVLVRARAGDPGAQRLASCIGESGRADWVSLGSRKLCLWQGEDGAACVGAREARLACPVINNEGTDCEVQLTESIALARAALTPPGGTPPDLTAVTVDKNLGVFADTIATSQMEMEREGQTNDGEPPCEDLRLIRAAGISQADRQQALNNVIHHPWMTQTAISREATRLGWEALPYDYSVVTRDGTPWAYTGDPTVNHFPNDAWPCGAPIDDSLATEAMAGARSCTNGLGGAMAGPLGCAYALDCRSSGESSGGVYDPNFLDRVRMNHRVGRAIVTLRIITATGLDDVALPLLITDSGGGAREGAVDRYTWAENILQRTFALPATANYFGMDGQGLTSTNVAGLFGSSVVATDTDGSSNQSVTREGFGYCISPTPCDPGSSTCSSSGSAVGGLSVANVGYLWTRLTDAAYWGTSATSACTEQCLRDNTCSQCFRVFAPCGDVKVTASNQRRGPFMAVSYTEDDANPPTTAVALATNRLWPGVGPQAAQQSGLIRRALQGFVDSEGLNPQDQFTLDESDFVARYWDERSSVRIADNISRGDVLDALELACASRRADFSADPDAPIGGVSNDPCSPDRLQGFQANGESDLAQLEDLLRCSANLIETNAERMVMRNVPLDLVETVQSEFGGATLPALQGDRGVLVGELTADIISLRTYRIQVSRIMREFADEMTLMRNDLKRQNIQRQQLRINLARDIANQITACAVALSPTFSGAAFPPSSSVSYNAGAAIATCINTAVQIGLATKQLENSLELVGLDQSDAFVRFNSAFHSHSDTLGQIEVDLIASGHRIQAGFTRLENMREEARRHLGQAMMFSSDAAGRQLRVNTLLRRRFVTAQDRYERARDHAIRMAFLAKLALEQRLGVKLSDLSTDMTLVEAPARWESSLCTMSGLDFERIRDGEDAEFESYADQYIGDYVSRLAQVAESYRLDFPFHEGADTAVVSMRDVLLAVRDRCDEGILVPNLVLSSGDLAEAPWSLGDTCVPISTVDDEDGEVGSAVVNCATVSPNVFTSARLGTPGAPWLGAIRPWRVQFGPSEPIPPTGAAAVVSGRDDTRLAQSFFVEEAGEFILSWYGRNVPGSPLGADRAVQLVVNGDLVASVGAPESILGGAACEAPGGTTDGWCRYWNRVHLSGSSTVTIAIAPNSSDAATVSGEGVLVGPQAVELAGIQFEDVSAALRRTGYAQALLRPTAYIATKSDGTSEMPLCEDTDGNVFREGWRYDCKRLCSTGFRTDCADESAELYCFWEHAFQINEEELRARGRLASTGFAVGNYNYRTDRMALNFVGTSVRQCEGSQLPSSCYGSGFVNYSLEHLGPYPITNHQGEEYLPPLFTGNIEYARGLSAERYLTNPLSSADRALIEPYSRGEFTGRPITGSYVIRIWDDGVVNFDRIEDVQILLDYRYWTRFR